MLCYQQTDGAQQIQMAWGSSQTDGQIYTRRKNSGVWGAFRSTSMIDDGGVGTPGLRFADDPDTGIYRDTANNIKFSVGGVKKAELNSSGYFYTFDSDGSSYQRGAGFYINRSAGYISNTYTGGGLYLQAQDGVYIRDQSTVKSRALFADTYVYLYADNVNKFAITTSSINCYDDFIIDSPQRFVCLNYSYETILGGSTNPYGFEVRGDNGLQGAGVNQRFRFAVNNDGEGIINNTYSTSGNHDIVIMTGNSERMRIDNTEVKITGIPLSIDGVVDLEHAGNSLEITTAYGTCDIGPKNGGYNHIYTNMSAGHYFDKDVHFNSANTYCSSTDMVIEGVSVKSNIIKVAQLTTSRDAAASDAGYILWVSSGNLALTIDENDFTEGDSIQMHNRGAGVPRIVRGTGSPVFYFFNGAGTATTVASAVYCDPGGIITIVCVDDTTNSNIFHVYGNAGCTLTAP